MLRVRPLGWLLAAVAAACLSACGSSDKSGGGLLHGKAAADKKPVATAAVDPTADMNVAVSALKGPSPITVKFQMADRPKPGQPLSLEFAVIPDATILSLAARFDGDEGLTVVSGDQVPAVEKPAANVPIRHTVTVVPKTDGIYTVTATITLTTSAESRTRIYAIPLISGSGLPQLAAHSEPHP